MGETNWRGPLNAMGSLEVDAGTTASIQPFDGPSGFYQGIVYPDIRGAPFPAEGTAPGRASGFLDIASQFTIDNKPQANATNVIATSQVATTSLAIALVTAAPAGANAGSPQLTVAVPILPGGTTVVTTAPIALDFGFTTGTTTAASSTVVVYDNTQFTLGQWLFIGGAGASGNTAGLFTQVTAIATANFTGINVFPLPTGSLNNAPIGQAALYGSGLLPAQTQFGPGSVTPTAINPNVLAGLYKVHNPREAIARNLSITLVTGGVATAVGFLALGWDLWRQPMSELITVPATTSATTAYGKKAFKFISSITPQSASTGGNSYAVGVGDVFGFPMRADEWEQTQILWNGCQVPTSLGFTGAVSTTGSPATNTTGDVRGTIQVSTVGGGSAAAVATAQVSNGTARLCVIQNAGVWNQIFGTPINTVPMFGNANSTN